MNTWTKMEDKQPIKEEMYIVYAPSMNKNKPFINIAWFGRQGEWELLPPPWAKAITHWMPLPGPPDK